MASHERPADVTVVDPAADPLLVDLYELTMAEAYRRDGMAERPATFSLFVRSLPPERAYLVAAGLDDALTWLEELAFGPRELAIIERLGLFPPEFLDMLRQLRFSGTVRAVPEGTIVFAEEPILEIDASMAEAQLAETFLLNQITLQTMLATKAARFRYAAAGRAVVDFSLRRTQGVDAGMKVARICKIVGLAGTSNVAGADRYGVAASGTMAHSFVQAHDTEQGAFRSFVDAFGSTSVLLVDTYDTPHGVERAIEVAREARSRGVEIRAIRLDSGDLASYARAARRSLDAAGFRDVQIFASGGLDEHEVHRLLHEEGAPIDGFGVGSSLGASTDAPTLDSVYKLAAYDGRPVRKTSPAKATWPGAKQVWREESWSEDVLTLADEPPPSARHHPLLVEVMREGRRTSDGRASLDDANARFEQQWEQLPAGLRRLTDAEPSTLRISERLQQTAREVDARRQEG